MNQNPSKKPFLPRDKPKSWVVLTICILASLLLAAPLAFSGIMFEIEALESFGKLLFLCCWIVGAAMWLVFAARSVAGHYKGIEDCDWRRQVW